MNTMEKKKRPCSISNYFYGNVGKVINNYGTMHSTENYSGDSEKQSTHFPLNKSEDEGRQWYDFLIGKGFIANDTEQACWLYMMGFSNTMPSELKPIAWLKTVETARLMIRKVHGNLLNNKQLSVARMAELASQCFTKQGAPLKLSKPKKEYSQDADDIENFLPTISDL